MKHQLIILSAILLITTIGIRLERSVRSLPVMGSVVSAAIEVPVIEDAVEFVRPTAHLEPAPTQAILRPALPEALEKSLTNKSFLIMNEDTGEILQERQSTVPMPLASLTKLLAAIVVVDHVQDWKAMVEILPEDIREGEQVVDLGNRLTFADLFAATLIRSSNTGMMALGRVVGLSSKQLTSEMNALAQQWGLSTTVITDPTGLIPTTVGSALDIGVILQKALERPEIRSVISKPQYTWPFYDRTGKIVRHKRVINTNELIHPKAMQGDLTIEGGKTGFIPEAQYHVAVAAQSVQGHRFIVVVLGAKTFDARFQEARAILEWINSTLPIPSNQT